VDVKTAEGCMNKLKDAGLVKEPERGIFQRRVPREREAPKLEICPPTPNADATPGTGATPILGNSQDASAAVPTVVLGEMAMTLRHMASLLNKIADTLDQSALEFEDRIEAVEKRLSRFRELSAFLKEF
jgi:hypothetical protein